jgi:hypothetical protein
MKEKEKKVVIGTRKKEGIQEKKQKVVRRKLENNECRICVKGVK